jgi:hypothetical protein
LGVLYKCEHGIGFVALKLKFENLDSQKRNNVSFARPMRDVIKYINKREMVVN